MFDFITSKKTASTNEIQFYRYTFKVWSSLKRFEYKKEWLIREWDRINKEDQLFAFIVNQMNSWNLKHLQIEDDGFASVLTLDDDYYNWLQDNKLKHNKKSLNLYSELLSYEDMTKKMILNKMNIQFSIKAIPLLIYGENFPAKTDFKLTEEETINLKEYLEKIYGKGCVYIPGYIMTIDNCIREEVNFKNLAKAHFEDGINAVITGWDNQIIKNCNEAQAVRMGIPLAVRHEYMSSIFSSKELYSRRYVFSQGCTDEELIKGTLAEHGIYDINSLDTTEEFAVKFARRLKKDGFQLYIAPCASMIDNLYYSHYRYLT